MVDRICKNCSKNFKIEKWRLKDPKRGKFCTKLCQNTSQRGKHYSIATEFKKGIKSWHSGTKGLKPAPKTAFKKGAIPWNKGKKFSYKPHLKMRGHIPWNKGKQGIMPIPWNKGKKRPEMTGENHFAWKGGTYTKNRKIDMQRKFYRDWRKEVLMRDNYTCIWCGVTNKLNVDHIKPYSLYPKLRYEVSNGRTLCGDCHKTTDTYGNKKKLLVKEVYQFATP